MDDPKIKGNSSLQFSQFQVIYYANMHADMGMSICECEYEYE